jgi:PRTRC genetic system ThiF family protein
MNNSSQNIADSPTLKRPGQRKAKSAALDFSFSRAAIFLPRNSQTVRLALVGCGGTGSWLAPQLARLARVLREQGRQTELLFMDPDYVNAANVPRSCFCDAEIGQPKAHALARRYGAAWGLDISVVAEPFTPGLLPAASGAETLDIIVGCVDNAAARRSLAEVLTPRSGYFYGAASASSVLLLDCGNTLEGGQVLLGNASRREQLRGAFAAPGLCTVLPSPYWQHPELLEDLPEELPGHNLSCAELMRRNAQSLMVNHYVASVAGDYLMRLLLTKDLRRYATYFDLAAGGTRNLYLTPENLACTAGCRPRYLHRAKQGAARR